SVDFSSLHATDLGFAVAFRLGCREAMDYLLREQRAQIGRLAAECAQSPSQVTRVTETLLRELQGHEMEDGRRQTLFERFDGQVALRDWLRTIVQREIAKESAADQGSRAACPFPEALAAYGRQIWLEAEPSQGRGLREKERNEIRLHLRDCSRCQAT